MSSHKPTEMPEHDMGMADTMFGGPSTAMSEGAANTALSAGVAAAASPAQLVGERIGRRYRVLRLLGAGGMGAVYLARDDELDELVAIKLLRAGIGSSQEAVAFMRQEVRLARRVTHRNVARIFELGEHEGQRFLTMEYIDGEPLSGLIRRSGRLPLERCVSILTAVCSGLQAVHEAGVIHRDVKPDNVLVAHGGRVVISDFGIARPTIQSELARDSLPAGTPAYMAPEQITGDELTPGADIYSLGVMAFEMVTGELPWKHMDSARGRLNAPPPDPRQVLPELPAAVAVVIMRAMARQPAERVPSPLAFAEALGQAVSLQTQGATPMTGAQLVVRTEPESKRSLIVLPFVNRGPAEDEFLAGGFTEDLIDRLCAVRDLKVLSRGVSARFAGDPREPHEIGRELGVSLVIEGSLQRTGSQMLVRSRAIESHDGAQLWAQRYQIVPEALLSTSDQVAEALLQTLELAGDQGKQRGGILAAGAMEAYLRAKEMYRSSRGGNRDMLAAFEEAHRLAPDNPLICAGYAMGLMRAWMLQFANNDQLVRKAKDLAERALQAGVHMGEPYMALGTIHLHLGRPVEAAREFRQALALAPSMPDAHAFLGMMLAELGRVNEALRRLETASSLDPTMLMGMAERRRIAALLGDWQRVEELDRAFPPPKAPLALGAKVRFASWRRATGALAEAAALMDNASMQNPALDEDELVHALRQSVAVYIGELPASELYRTTRLEQVTEGQSRRRLSLLQQIRAEVAGYAGDIEVALESIEQGMAVGLIDLMWLERCPLLESVREHRRYRPLHRELLERAYDVYDALWS